ncbi:MAG TPA: MAPEG family protein [Solimonas sp.]
MTTALWCVLVAALLPFLFTGLAKASKRFDNAAPRDYFEQSTGWRKRAHWAQLNSFEAFPAFAAAVIIAQIAAGPNATADKLALIFIAARLVYGVLYVVNKPTLRSLAWLVGIGCVIGLFVVASHGHA